MSDKNIDQQLKSIEKQLEIQKKSLDKNMMDLNKIINQLKIITSKYDSNFGTTSKFKEFKINMVQLIHFIFSGFIGKLLFFSILLETIILLCQYLDHELIKWINSFVDISGANFYRHLNLIINIFPFILLIFIAFLYLYKLFEFKKTENKQVMSKMFIIITNIFFILFFLILAMSYPWSTIEPIITVATAIILPYIFWLDKNYK